MAFQTFTLTGTYHLFDGTPESGIVEIIPSERQVKDTTGNVILSGRVKATLDADGHFSVTLPDPNDATLNPTGFGYTVVAKLRHQHLPAVSFGGDQITGGAVDVEDVTSVDPSTFSPTTTYAEQSDLDTVLAEAKAYTDQKIGALSGIDGGAPDSTYNDSIDGGAAA